MRLWDNKKGKSIGSDSPFWDKKGKSIGSDSPFWVVIKIEYHRFFGVSKVPICWSNRNSGEANFVTNKYQEF
jgi:hypothetical protein